MQSPLRRILIEILLTSVSFLLFAERFLKLMKITFKPFLTPKPKLIVDVAVEN